MPKAFKKKHVIDKEDVKKGQLQVKSLIKPYGWYDYILVNFSGGKDSIAMILTLFDQGVKPSQIIVFHQCIDGKHGTDTHTELFDWPATEGYVYQFCKHFKLALWWQWREHGFYGEIMKRDRVSYGVHNQIETFTDQKNTDLYLAPEFANASFRLKFPAKSGDISQRWCSGQLKIDPASRVVNNHPLFSKEKAVQREIRILWLTGERREESTNRAHYDKALLPKMHSGFRFVHQYRLVLDMTEEKVWELIEKNKILPHPAYYLGFPRLSCRTCIFYTKDHWKTIAQVDPQAVVKIIQLEKELNFTIDNKFTVTEMIKLGTTFIDDDNKKFIPQAVTFWNNSIITDNWKLPKGAFGEGGGSI
ncbi:MAG: phosphoadenosine phosphosulfate reductase family protein [Parachlamydiales bacterium]|jgi:3'-phosphoadenosine 5'-phosphosulfate sulfotransferase (PAPS reductase)/FAD synthetase